MDFRQKTLLGSKKRIIKKKKERIGDRKGGQGEEEGEKPRW